MDTKLKRPALPGFNLVRVTRKREYRDSADALSATTVVTVWSKTRG
jgi:hypothetical protein